MNIIETEKLDKIKKSKTFKVNDIICHENNYLNNLFLWAKATDYDVENYSGKNGYYYIKDNTERQID